MRISGLPSLPQGTGHLLEQLFSSRAAKGSRWRGGFLRSKQLLILRSLLQSRREERLWGGGLGWGSGMRPESWLHCVKWEKESRDGKQSLICTQGRWLPV